jgi:predicted lysophospholipase L1 biosynthesis ABC-type transport system permease subunit
VRLALGASRTRLLRQFLAESCLLTAIGAILGVALSQLLSRALLRSIATTEETPALPLSPSWRVLVFTVVIAAATCMVFGTAPAVRATRITPAMAWGRGMTASRERFSIRRIIVVTQIALSLVLLVAALLFVRSFRNLMTFDPGMRQAGITFGFLRLPLTALRHE